jgi:hypothetical protein
MDYAMNNRPRVFYGGVLFLSFLILITSGCIEFSSKDSISSCPAGATDIIRMEPGANILLELRSNKPKTTFTIDGKKLDPPCRKLKVYISSKRYVITAEPEGYRLKKEIITPPYVGDVVLSFTYLLEETGAEE